MSNIRGETVKLSRVNCGIFLAISEACSHSSRLFVGEKSPYELVLASFSVGSDCQTPEIVFLTYFFGISLKSCVFNDFGPFGS